MVGAAEMTKLMKRSISEISDVLAIPVAVAQPLLRNHKWAKDRLLESYTNDSDKEIKRAGVYFRCTKHHSEDRKLVNSNDAKKKRENNHSCAICCNDDLTPADMLAMPCEHEMCIECWQRQIKVKLEEGPSCILATCPQPKCNELVTEEEVSIATPDLLAKFEGYQLQNFVETNGKSRWCPGPGCDRIAAITAVNWSLADADSIMATCDKCLTCFCLKCGNEPHAPLICVSLEKWQEKCKNESETANWILANTKTCPKCRVRIEKNQGCNHMTCQHCRYEFCWICSGDWKDHGANTGGYYNCNKFDDKNNNSEDQSDAAKAKRELDRYLHYYQRYHAHADAQKFAMKHLKDTEQRMILLQESNSNATWSDVEFLKTANEQLVQCRRVLKFTYVFAYYMTAPVASNNESSSATNADSNPKGKGKAKRQSSLNYRKNRCRKRSR